MPGDRDRGDCPPLRYRIDPEHRAGHPESIAPWAICGRPQTRYGRYTAWYVAGGGAFGRLARVTDRLLDRPAPDTLCQGQRPGTWGLDYQGFFGRSKVWLSTTGRPDGYEGAYETDAEPSLARLAERFERFERFERVERVERLHRE